jgi:hypothetical protein
MSENNEAPQAPVVETPAGTATEADLDRIIKAPATFGFKWIHEPISAIKDNAGNLLANGSKVELRKDAPRIRLLETQEAIEAFGKAFGWALLAKAYNGTSGDVQAEGIARSELLKKWHTDRAKSVSMYDLQAEIVKRCLLGQRAKGGGGGGTRYVGTDGVSYKTEAEAVAASKQAAKPATFKGLDGVEYPTQLEAKQASVAFLVDKGTPSEIAIAAVANM